MKVLHSWLAEFVPGLLEHPIAGDPDALGEAMSSLGLECDSVTAVGGGLDGIVVCKVLDLGPHPDADRIQLVQVETGGGNGTVAGEPLQICCGAFNMAVGDLVPLATLGTTMPGGMEIARRKMRGEWSNGMLCSGKELNLGDDHEGIFILDPTLTVGVGVAEALEIVADVVFDIDLTPNRPDAFSVIGIARDIAAKFDLPFVLPDIVVPESGTDVSELVSVSIDAPDLCGRFSARVLSGITVGESPRWLQQRLTHCGMRPINSIVDVSNYVMLEYGQPNHTYDLAKVPGGALTVRWATEGEALTTLDDKERKVTAADGVIADSSGAAIGIAGVMGGASTEISGSTESVLLELAWWDPTTISVSSKRLGLRSEASSRYEKGVDPRIAPRAALRIAQLLVEQGAVLHPGLVVAEGNLAAPTVVTVRTARVNALLGTDFSTAEIARLAGSVGFSSALSDGSETATNEDDELQVTVPSWRRDATGEVDVIEEVARLYGYPNLGKTVPKSPKGGGLTDRQQDIRRLRSFLADSGASEATPMSFLAPGDLEASGVRSDGVKVANPLVAEESILRTSLLPGLVKTLGYNAAHRNTGISLFEVGHCFAQASDGGLPEEWEEVAVVLGGHEAPAAVELARKITSLFGVVDVAIRNVPVGGLHPGRAGIITAHGKPIGEVGEIDPAVGERYGVSERVGYVAFTLGGDEPWHGDLGLLSVQRADRQFVPISRMPSSDVDFAFVVADTVSPTEVLATIREAGAPLVTSAELFDVFRGASVTIDHRSLAFRVRIQATDRTLTETEINEVRTAIIDAVSSQHGGTLRA